MKKKVLFILLAMSTGLIMADPEDDNSDSSLVNPHTICLADKGHNTGRCKERVDGLGSSCVKVGSLQTKNCYDDMAKPEL